MRESRELGPSFLSVDAEESAFWMMPREGVFELRGERSTQFSNQE
jgi:hypothetical protein